MDNLSGVVMPQAQPVSLRINVDKNTLSEKCTSYWNAVKDRLSPEVVQKATKGGFRKVTEKRVVRTCGGKAAFYRVVLLDLVNNFMADKDRQVISYGAVDLDESSDTSSSIMATAFLEPEVRWKTDVVPGVNEKIDIHMNAVTDDHINKILDTNIKNAQETNVVLVPDTSTDTTKMGHVVALDCQSLIDGEKWEPGCFVNNKWLLDPIAFKMEGMVDNLVGLKVGEQKAFELVLGDKFGDKSGKNVSITVRVNQIFNKEVPAVDDDLATTLGFKDLEAWKKDLLTKINNMVEEERKNFIMSQIHDKLMAAVDVDPVPGSWALNKAVEIYKQQRELFHTEEDLLKHYFEQGKNAGVHLSSKEEVLFYFGNMAITALTSDLVFRKWGKVAGIEGNTSLEGVYDYLPVVKQELLNRVNIVNKE